MEPKIKVLGFAGSLRKGSYNKALLRAALELVPDNMSLEIFDLEGLPLFNQDLENDPPPKLREFKSKIKAADAILIASPEYNYSIPGVLKNALDCASRPHGDNVLEGKPVAIMGASIGMTGTARAQYHLRQSFVFLNMYAVNSPEIMVPYASEKNFPEGRLADQKSRDLIRQLLVSLADWTIKLKGEKEVKKAA
jgi:chromate reductase